MDALDLIAEPAPVDGADLELLLLDLELDMLEVPRARPPVDLPGRRTAAVRRPRGPVCPLRPPGRAGTRAPGDVVATQRSPPVRTRSPAEAL
ncbi:hypothetical protein [Rhodococcus indonesiensis]